MLFSTEYFDKLCPNIRYMVASTKELFEAHNLGTTVEQRRGNVRDEKNFRIRTNEMTWK